MVLNKTESRENECYVKALKDSQTLIGFTDIDSMITYKEYYSGYCCRWLLCSRIPNIIATISDQVAKVKDITSFLRYFKGSYGADTINTIYYALTNNRCRMGSKYCIRHMFSSFETAVLEKYMDAMDEDPESEGSLAEAIVWRQLKVISLRSVS